ncbi:MAG: hypothetical protein OEM67_09080 [Thermoleophilia bacterium]|nr:hypothetical protein [Thermoleophilia bacterium]
MGGPRSAAILTDGWLPQVNGVVRTVDDLASSITRALDCDREACRPHPLTFTRGRCAEIFADVVEPIARTDVQKAPLPRTVRT